MKRLLKIIGLCLIAFVSVFTFSACGESAYELAVQNGYKGTLSEWLESLKGKNGQNGENGIDYEDLRSLYNDLYNNGEYTDTFLNFIRDYISIYDLGSAELIANHALLSSVSITSVYTTARHTYAYSGSGVIYEIDSANEEVYVVTNYHVVYIEDTDCIANSISINLYGKEDSSDAISCKYIGGSEAYDVAVLEISGQGARTIINEGYEAVEIAEYNDVTVGQSLIAVGNAKGEGITVVSGVLSSESRTIPYKISSIAYYHRVLQFDAQINSGNSGGGLFDKYGKMIGIVCAKHLTTLDSSSYIDITEGMCYGVPIVNIDAIYNYIKNNYTGTSLSMKVYNFGIDYIAANSTAYYDTTEHKTKIVQDVAISSVEGLGESIGLQEDDIIKSVTVYQFAGKTISFDITRDFMFEDILTFVNGVGDRIVFEVQRDGGVSNISHIITLANDVAYKSTPEQLATYYV